MSRPIRVACFSIVPSPYQRDLFAALAKRPEVSLKVFYNEAGSPDSPWPKTAMRDFEEVLKGFYISWKQSRFIINYSLPDTSDFDVIILNGYTTLPAQRILRRRKKQKLIFWAEKLVGPTKAPKKQIQQWLSAGLKKVEAIVAIGKAAYLDYQQRFPGKPVHSLPYTCSLDAFMAGPRTTNEVPVILFCGQMIHRKGFDVLLEAFNRVIQEGLEARLLLVGRETELTRSIESLPANTQAMIENAGFQAPEALPAFFNRSDLFVLPSRYDGWGVVVNQALGAGLPVIATTAVGAAADLVRPGENGAIYQADDVDELTRLIRTRIGNPSLRQSEGEASKRIAMTITPDSAAARWVEILQETAGMAQ